MSEIRTRKSRGRPFPLILAVLFALAAILGVFAACSLFDDEAGEKSRLADATARWNANGYDDYEFVLHAICGECTQYTLRIRVRGGQIAEVSDGVTPVPPDYRTHTVPELFTMIRGWLDGKPYSFHAEYDAALGHPVSASHGPSPSVADGGWGFGVSGLKPIPALPAGAP